MGRVIEATAQKLCQKSDFYLIKCMKDVLGYAPLSVVECLNEINILKSTTQPLGQNTRYTELCMTYENLE